MSHAAEQTQPETGARITIHVNGQPVSLEGHRHTGIAIKQAAIAQGVKIEVGYILYEEIDHDRTKHIKDQEEVVVNDESRFLADEAVVTVHVNRHPVKLDGHRHNGLQIKQAAINQGVNIKLDFLLFEEFSDGHTKPVKDTETITVSNKSKFDAIPDDDHS